MCAFMLKNKMTWMDLPGDALQGEDHTSVFCIIIIKNQMKNHSFKAHKLTRTNNKKLY